MRNARDKRSSSSYGSEIAETVANHTEHEPIASKVMDPLLQVKEYAWEGFSHAHCGSREEFEELWAGAFDDLFYLHHDIRFA